MPRRRLPRPGSLTKGIGAVRSTKSGRPADAGLIALRARLLAHYDANRRTMPWRGEADPYRVWVSEVMLQQTRVETVRDRYPAFLAAFPTIRALADASEEAVLKAWEGLGYYARARNLRRAARAVVESGADALPDSVEGLRELPGFGPYTAAAVASIAFRRAAAVVDGNVERVLARLLDEGGDVRSAGVRARIAGEADRLLDPARPGDWNQAMMDLGATVCVPRAPRCLACPVEAHCLGRAAGRAERLPVKPRRAATPHFDVAAGIVWKDGRVLVARRPAEGLLGGLFEFPGGKRREGETLEAACAREVREETGLRVEVTAPFVAVDHAYSHFRITLHTFHCRVLGGRLAPSGCEDPRFVAVEDLTALPFPRANVRVLEALRAAVARGEAPPAARRSSRARSRPRRPRPDRV